MREQFPASMDFIDDLQGTPEAKERLKWIVLVHGGMRTVSEACAALDMSPQEFDDDRENALAAMMAALQADR